MKRYKTTKEKQAELARSLEGVNAADRDVIEKESALKRATDEVAAIVRVSNEFDRNGDIRDLQKVAENEARRKQIALLARDVDAAKANVEKAEAAVESALRGVAVVIRDIGDEGFAYVRDQLIETIKPFFMDEGRARIVVESSFDIDGNILTWLKYFPRGTGAHAIRGEVERALENISKFGLPDGLGCQIWKAFGINETPEPAS